MTTSEDNVTRIQNEFIARTERSEDATTGFLMSKEDWFRIRRMAVNVKQPVQWWLLTSTAAIGVSLPLFINAYFASVAKLPDLKIAFQNLYVAVLFAALAVLCLFMHLRQEREGAITKDILIEEFNQIEISRPGAFPRNS